MQTDYFFRPTTDRAERQQGKRILLVTYYQRKHPSLCAEAQDQNLDENGSHLQLQKRSKKKKKENAKQRTIRKMMTTKRSMQTETIFQKVLKVKLRKATTQMGLEGAKEQKSSFINHTMTAGYLGKGLPRLVFIRFLCCHDFVLNEKNHFRGTQPSRRMLTVRGLFGDLLGSCVLA